MMNNVSTANCILKTTHQSSGGVLDQVDCIGNTLQESSKGVGDIGVAEHFTLVERKQEARRDASDSTDECRESGFDGAE